MVRRLSVFLLLALGCSKRSSSLSPALSVSSPYPVLATGPNRQTAITNVPPLYQFRRAAGIMVDARELYAVGGAAAKTPDMVQVITPSGIYGLSKTSLGGRFTLDSSTLTPFRGPPFSGFRPGEAGAIEVGHSLPAAGGVAFHVWWVARFSVN